MNGIYIRNSSAVGYNRSGSATPAWPFRYMIIPGIFNKILSDEKITGETHFFDDIQLKIQTLLYFRGYRSIAFRQPRFTKFAQVGIPVTISV